MQARQVMIYGALFAAIAVALGAFGAHGLRAVLDPRALEIWRTAVMYQMFHALALLAIGALGLARPDFRPGAAGLAFVAGILLFSGSLYGLALGDLAWLAPLTPMGGLAYLAGWFILVLDIVKLR